MIKEYIDKLSQENEQELEKYNNQMQKLIEELEDAKQYLEDLQKQSNVQINIFSPRNIDDTMEEKLETARKHVLKIEEEIEQTKGLIEALVEKKKEYEVLEKEIQEPSVQKNDMASVIKNAIEKNLFAREHSERTTEKDIIYKEGIEKERVQKDSREMNGEETGKGTEQGREKENEKETEKENVKETEKESEKEIGIPEKNVVEEKNITQEAVKKELLDKINIFMNRVYRKNEMCLALLNSDKNKCKSELLSIKKEIKQFASEIENMLK